MSVKLPQTRALGAPVHWFDETPSTNVTLEALWHDDTALPDGSLVLTGHQTAGRGRQGRGWQTPPGKCLAASVLVRGFVGLEASWLPLVAGAAVVLATEPVFASERRVAVKWPNDVHMMREVAVDAPGAAAETEMRLGSKLNGILCQLLPDGSAIIGVGTNLFLTNEELPTERAGSWLAEGAELYGATQLADPEGERIADEYLVRYLTELRRLVSLARTRPSALIDEVSRHSATLGTRVRVHLPGGEQVVGTATALESDGALTVARDGGGLLTVHAGDVEHVREASAN